MRHFLKAWAALVGAYGLTLVILLVGQKFDANFTTEWRLDLVKAPIAGMTTIIGIIAIAVILSSAYDIKRLVLAPLIAAGIALGATPWMATNGASARLLAPDGILGLTVIIALLWWFASPPPEGSYESSARSGLLGAAVFMFAIELWLLFHVLPDLTGQVPTYETHHFTPEMPWLLAANAFMLILLQSWDRLGEGTASTRLDKQVPALKSQAAKQWSRGGLRKDE